MTGYLDVSTWARRTLFEFFRDYEDPYFNICVRVDVTALLTALRDRPGTNVSLAYHYFALRVANEIESFRYRLRDGRVWVHDVIHGGTTVLLPDETFSFVNFLYHDDFESFMRPAQADLLRVQTGTAPFEPASGDAVIHFTALPWLAFTSFKHARKVGLDLSIPKIAFGKFSKENNRVLLPISVEVHHALMDGLHVGRFISRLEEVLSRPEEYLGSRQ